MPNTSLTRTTVGESQLSVSLPSNSFIREFLAAFDGTHWTVSIITTQGQTSVIGTGDGRPLCFLTLESVARFLARQGADSMSVSLLGLVTKGGIK